MPERNKSAAITIFLNGLIDEHITNCVVDYDHSDQGRSPHIESTVFGVGVDIVETRTVHVEDRSYIELDVSDGSKFTISIQQRRQI
jgi:hypothetical protein